MSHPQFSDVAVSTSPAPCAGPATARKDVGRAVSGSPVTGGQPSSDRREVARRDHARQVLRVDAALAAWTDDAPPSLCSRGCDRAVFAEGLCESHFEQRLDDTEGER